jgi:hypothetical protein
MVDAYRSGLEEKVAKRLKDAGVKFDYEGEVLRFQIPAFNARYTPDFPIVNTPIIIEAKGRFGDKFGNGAEVRQRLILAKEQNPNRDIRIVFQNANLKIYKGSKTTYAKWAADHGFKWSDKGVVPQEWIDELQLLQKRKK